MSPQFRQLGSEKHCSWRISCILISNKWDYYTVETNNEHCLKCKVKLESFSFSFIFSLAMTSEAFILSPAQTIPFVKSVSLSVPGITHKDTVVCSNLPVQPFLLALSLGDLMLRLHENTHAAQTHHLFLASLPLYMLSPVYGMPLPVTHQLASHLPPLSGWGPDPLSFAHCICCRHSTSPIAY